MSRKLRLAYFAHTIRSDWNNGNAHFLRGLLRALGQLGHDVTAFEPEHEWSVENLLGEPNGKTFAPAICRDVSRTSRFNIRRSNAATRVSGERACAISISSCCTNGIRPSLRTLCWLAREDLGCKLLFHDTHHRASSSPEQIERFGIQRFDGVLAFGEALRRIYRERFGIERVWTLHEAADTTVFHPIPCVERDDAMVWIGNWGDGERSREIRDVSASAGGALRRSSHTRRCTVCAIRRRARRHCANTVSSYGGYLPNLDAPALYAHGRADSPCSAPAVQLAP